MVISYKLFRGQWMVKQLPFVELRLVANSRMMRVRTELEWASLCENYRKDEGTCIYQGP